MGKHAIIPPVPSFDNAVKISENVDKHWAKCEYCGTKVDANEMKCANCGAVIPNF